MRTFFGILGAVLTSLAVPVGLIVLTTFPAPLPGEGDAYIRAVLGIGMLLPAFAALLILYHGLGAVVAQALPVHPWVALLILSVLASAVFAALFLASGAPLSWDRAGDFGIVMIALWVVLALGSTVQYLVCFKKRPSRAA